MAAWGLEELIGCRVVAPVAEQAREERDAEDAWLGVGAGSGVEVGGGSGVGVGSG